MQTGLYWIRAREITAGRHEAFWTIGNCVDGKNIEPINPAHQKANVEALGPYIGSVLELTGRTAEYVKPQTPAWTPYRKPKPEELVI